MISIFNRAQLPPLFDPARRDSLCQALDQAGIEYTVKTVDRSSPSALNFGSRERGGTLLHQMEQNWYYLVYVKKSDWEAAQRLLRPNPQTYAVSFDQYRLYKQHKTLSEPLRFGEGFPHPSPSSRSLTRLYTSRRGRLASRSTLTTLPRPSRRRRAAYCPRPHTWLGRQPKGCMAKTR